jgi:putative acetyltransferase
MEIKIVIRNLNSKDMDQVIAIWLKASIKAHSFIDREVWESHVRDMRETYIPASDTYVFEEDGRIQGFISLHNSAIAAIFVSPDMQGIGIGRKLISKAKKLHNTLTLTVYKDNLPSTEFYKKCGFKIVQEQTDPHTGCPELLMQFSQ